MTSAPTNAGSTCQLRDIRRPVEGLCGGDRRSTRIWQTHLRDSVMGLICASPSWARRCYGDEFTLRETDAERISRR